jgi:hypothetical protein
VGTGLLGIPVLAGASAYAISDTFGWSEGLGKKFRQAKQFYVVIIASTVIGLLINFIGINAMLHDRTVFLGSLMMIQAILLNQL